MQHIIQWALARTTFCTPIDIGQPDPELNAAEIEFIKNTLARYRCLLCLRFGVCEYSQFSRVYDKADVEATHTKWLLHGMRKRLCVTHLKMPFFTLSRLPCWHATRKFVEIRRLCSPHTPESVFSHCVAEHHGGHIRRSSIHSELCSHFECCAYHSRQHRNQQFVNKTIAIWIYLNRFHMRDSSERCDIRGRWKFYLRCFAKFDPFGVQAS